MLRWHRARRVHLCASSRVFDPDTNAMRPAQQTQLRLLLKEHGVEVAGSAYRLGVSRLGGPDFLGGPPSARLPEELARFIEIVGPDPSGLPPSAVGKAFARKVGDYDALQTHFALGYDVFVTLDTKDYLHVARRGRYASELGLIVQSAADFVAEHAASFDF
ncbi:MAG: hypothetical protein L0Z62_21950 [Gemmataceae bacterium]|nr:hypothetical protein [Gemmataceae bacterium]